MYFVNKLKNHLNGGQNLPIYAKEYILGKRVYKALECKMKPTDYRVTYKHKIL